MEPEEYDRLLKRANDHDITREEFELAAAELANPNRKGDPGILMAVLRRDRTRSYESLMAPFLKGPNVHPASNALIYICLEYGQTAHYTADILRFMQGVEFDRYDRLRGDAIAIAGNYLNSAHDSQLLRQLIYIAERETNTIVRTEAYQALFEALGHNGPPYGERDINAERERDYERLGPEVIEEAKERLRSEEGMYNRHSGESGTS